MPFNVGEFLTRKAGPLPYWAWGLLGAGVIAGTIWASKSGLLNSLTGTAGSQGAGSGSAGGGGIPPSDIITTGGSAPSDPLLIGQQSGTTDGGLSGTIPGPTPGTDTSTAEQRFQEAADTRATAQQAIQTQITRDLSGADQRAQELAFNRASQGPIVLSTPIPTTQTQVVQRQRMGGALQ